MREKRNWISIKINMSMSKKMNMNININRDPIPRFAEARTTVSDRNIGRAYSIAVPLRLTGRPEILTSPKPIRKKLRVECKQIQRRNPARKKISKQIACYFFLAGLRRWICLHSTLSFLRIGFGLVRISGRPVSLKGTAMEYARPMFLSDTVVLASANLCIVP